MSLKYPRITALLAILLTAVNLRAAITALSPLIPRIQESLGVSGTVIGILGMVPTAMFAISAFALPPLKKHLTFSQLLFVAMLLTGLGQLWRSFGDSTWSLIAGSLIAFFSIGVTNAALPLAVREYFPNHVPGLSTAYMVVSQIVQSFAAILAEPLAQIAEERGLTGWMWSLATWGLFGLIAAITWLPLLTRRGPKQDLRVPQGAPKAPVWRTKVGWGLALTFGFTSFVTYSLMTFIPRIFADAGADSTLAGGLLAYWSILGLPLSIVGPWIAGRFARIYPVVLFTGLLFVIGNLGMVLAPMAAPWLWVTFSGLGPITFYMAITLINVRARTMDGATGLSSFGQGMGYALASPGPLLTGFIADVSGSFVIVGFVWVAATIVVMAGAWFVTRQVFVEDQMER